MKDGHAYRSPYSERCSAEPPLTSITNEDARLKQMSDSQYGMIKTYVRFGG